MAVTPPSPERRLAAKVAAESLSGTYRLTNHSSRTRFAGRLNSGVRQQMQHFDIVNLYNRGLANFESLSSLERDVFVIHELNLWYEMEGTLEDYFLGDSYAAQIRWLTGTLHRIGDMESTAILDQLLRLTWEQREAVATLSERFYSLMESRSHLLEQYLHQHGAAIAW